MSLSNPMVIQTEGPRIVCAPPWCEGEITIAVSPERVLAELSDFEQYPQLFPRVRTATIISEEIRHLSLAMPFPLQDRDYAIAVTIEEESIYFVPAPFPITPNVVRLPDFAGRWVLTPDGPNQTVVRYIWHTDLGADIPSWAIRRAWSIQGNEVLGRLKLALEEG